MPAVAAVKSIRTSQTGDELLLGGLRGQCVVRKLRLLGQPDSAPAGIA